MTNEIVKTIPTKPFRLAHSTRSARPKLVHEQLRDRIFEAIVAHGSPGDKVPAERELSLRFGVSPMTMSRALNTLQDEGYLERLPGKGTFLLEKFEGRIESARDYPETSPVVENVMPNTWILSNLIADHLNSDILSHWCYRCATSLERAIQAIGGRTLLTDFGGNEVLRPYASVQEAISAGINSVVLLDPISANPHHLQLVQQLVRSRLTAPTQLAIIELSFRSYARWPFDCVRFSGEWGTFRVVEHLLELGHRNFVFLGDIDIRWAKQRLWAFETMLSAVDTCEYTVFGGKAELAPGSPDDFNWPNIAEKVVEAFVESKAFRTATAAVCINDKVAKTLLSACSRSGIACPEDISIAGFDNELTAATCGLTTVHAPLEEIGHAAAELLYRRLQRPASATSEEIVIYPSLVARSTTGSCPPSHPDHEGTRR